MTRDRLDDLRKARNFVGLRDNVSPPASGRRGIPALIRLNNEGHTACTAQLSTEAAMIQRMVAHGDRVGERSSRKRHATRDEAHVIVAEDDDDLRRMIVAALRKDGHRVSQARNGSELLHCIATDWMSHRHRAGAPPSQVIVTDICMPVLDGIEVLSGLRRSDVRVPIILITALGDERVLAEAFRLGAVAVFRKPFELNVLQMVVSDMVRP